jgi:hypothetical protein
MDVHQASSQLTSLGRDNMNAASSVKAKDAVSMLAAAKSLPDALQIVTNPRAQFEDCAEDEVVMHDMQCFIGLDGTSQSVPITQGMTMAKLKKKVQKITGIPTSEQKYVFADEAQLVGCSDPVPTNATLRCVRSQSDDEKSETSQKDPQADDQENTTEMETSSDGDQTQEILEKQAGFTKEKHIAKERRSWADLSDDECSVLPTAGNELDPCDRLPSDLARRFTERWRAWDEQQRHHQFYIAIPEHARDELYVVEEIKSSSSQIYRPKIIVRLRGRGSGLYELPRQGWKEKESTDPLMICLSGTQGYSLSDYWHTFYMVASLLEDTIYIRYNESLAYGEREVHLSDAWVHGGVRAHGTADQCRTIAMGSIEDNSDANKQWAREFTDKWREWDENERQHQFLIAIPEHSNDELQVVKRIKMFCRTNFVDGVPLRCRGRGSGFLEGKHKSESTDPFMICISGRNKYDLEAYWDTFYRLAAFLEADLYADYNQRNQKNRMRGKFKEVHLVYKDVHGGSRKGARINP